VFAQQERADIRRGNKQYNDSNYTEAEVHYRRGLDINDHSFEAHYNLGDALFRQGKYPEALEQYTQAEKALATNDKVSEAKRKEQLADTYHNIGNALYAQQQYDQAVGAYQQALRLDPKDNDTRYNLVKAMQQLQQQQQQQNQQQQQQEQQQEQQQQQQQQSAEQRDDKKSEQLMNLSRQAEKRTKQKVDKAMQNPRKMRLEKNW
jgi:tetratricopeptide (TPR) repeat protein